jgi:hypothetical protein
MDTVNESTFHSGKLSAIATIGLLSCLPSVAQSGEGAMLPPGGNPVYLITAFGGSVDDRLLITFAKSGETILETTFGNRIKGKFKTKFGTKLRLQAFDWDCGAAYSMSAVYLVNLTTGQQQLLHPEIPGHYGETLPPDCHFLDKKVRVAI